MKPLRTLLIAIIASSMPLTCWGQFQHAPARYKVDTEHIWVPMRDGVRLAMDLYMPQGTPPGEKLPVVFEADPYRGVGIADDAGNQIYFARRGLVAGYLELRGTGPSEGHVIEKEYSKQELDDMEDAVAWLARQPWSNGSVGVFGGSWSGMNGLFLAMRHPLALKAVMACCSSEKLYNEDVHYLDGILHVDGYMLSIDTSTAALQSPEFPLVTNPLDDKTMAERFEHAPWSLLYLKQQRDGDFWNTERIPLESIQVPIFLLGGFLDMYRDTLPRYLEHMKAPVKAIIGPWEHTWPHDARPGPEVEWRDIAMRWWDQWLRGKPTGIMSEPRLSVYMRHWYPPDPSSTKFLDVPGEWRSETSWPPKDQEIQTLYLQSNHTLSGTPAAAAVHDLKYVPSSGTDVSGYSNVWGDMGVDQRPADAFSLVYDTPPLERDTAILGLPEALLQASASAPLAHWFVRLSDVSPDGPVMIVTGGGLNGAQRDSMSQPQDLQPEKIYPLRVHLHFTSWVFPRGHRIRVSVSNAQFPMMWPTPYVMTTSLHVGGDRASHLLLPTVPLVSSLPAPRFNTVADSDRPPHPIRSLPVPSGWTLQRSEFGAATMVYMPSYGSVAGQDEPDPAADGSFASLPGSTFRVDDEHPESASYSGNSNIRIQVPGHQFIWRGHLDLRSDRANFYYVFKRELLENGKQIREKKWEAIVPRDHQ